MRRHWDLTKLWAKSLCGRKEQIFLLLIFIAWYWPEFYGHQLYVLGTAILITIALFSPYHLSLKSLLIYHFLLSCYFLAFSDAFRPEVQLHMDLAANRVLFFEAALIIGVLFFQKIKISIIGMIAVIGSILTIFGSGLTYVTTMNSAFLAVLLPFVPPIFLPLPLYAIFLEKGALSYAIVSIHLLVYGIYYRSRWYLGAFLGAMVLGGWYLGESIYCSGRAVFYPWALQEWWGSNIWIGSGLGSFQVLGPLIQKKHSFQPSEYWLSLHNEWLQALLETGIIGVVLLVWVFLDFLWRQRKEPILFSTMLGLGACGFFYYPFKIPIFALVFAVLTAEGLYVRQNQ